jgi:predicted PurR-regulated permease PerM
VNSFERPYTFDRVVRIVISIAVIVGLYLLIRSIRWALLPFLLGWLLAYLINPAVGACQQRLGVRNRGLAILVTLTAICGVIFLIFYALSPVVAREASRFVETVGQFRDSSGNFALIPASWLEFIRNIDFEKIAASLTREDILSILNGTGTGLAWLFTGSMSVLGWLFMLSLVALYLVFILVDYDKVVQWGPKIIPPKYKNTVLMISHDMKEAMNRYFRGQALVVLCVTVLYSAGFAIIGLPLGVLLGIFIGILNFVPYLQIVGYIPALLLCVLKAVAEGGNFWWIALSAIIVLAAVQVVQDAFLVPRIQGKMSGLNPALILLSLSVWGILLGFVGLILAIPLTSLLISYYDRVIIKQKELYQLPDSNENSAEQ